MRGCFILLLPVGRSGADLFRKPAPTFRDHAHAPAILLACATINAQPPWRATGNDRNMRHPDHSQRGRGHATRQRKALMETMKVDRRKFLAGVAGAGAASTVAAPHSAAAAPAVKFPSAVAQAAETLVP